MAPKNHPLIRVYELSILLDNVEIHNRNGTVEVVTNHLLTVTGHHALAGGEVVWVEDRRCNDERNVRSVDVTCLKVAASLVSNEDLVPWEVRILVDSEAVTQRTDWCCTKLHWVTDLTLAIKAVVGLVEDGSLEDCCNIR